MRNDLTEIVCIVDQSTSMGGLRAEVITGINQFIKSQREQEGEANFTLIFFDSTVKLIHNSININDVPDLTNETYRPQGCTAMNDGIAMGINTIGAKLHTQDESERAGKVIVAIMTDGQENQSREFTTENIKDMIDHQTEKYSWEFIFMAANIDLDTAADAIGIRGNNRYAFAATAKGVDSAYMDLSVTTSMYRSK